MDADARKTTLRMIPSISPISCWRGAGSGRRVSTVNSQRPGMMFVPPGNAWMRPTVATAGRPTRLAAPMIRSIMAAAPTSASLRMSIGVVPA